MLAVAVRNILRNFTFKLAFHALIMTIISTANAQGRQKASELPGTYVASTQELKDVRAQLANKLPGSP